MLSGLFLTACFAVHSNESVFFAPVSEEISSSVAHCQPWLMQVTVDLGETSVSQHEVVDAGKGMG